MQGTVSCKKCGFVWHSREAADALASIGECVRCHGPLSFEPQTVDGDKHPEPAPDVPPFLVLGTPRSQL